MMMSEERLNMLYNQQKYGDRSTITSTITYESTLANGKFFLITILPLLQPILFFFAPLIYGHHTGDYWGSLAALFIGFWLIFTIGFLMDLLLTILSLIGIQKESKAYILPLCINALLLITKSVCLLSVFAGGL